MKLQKWGYSIAALALAGCAGSNGVNSVVQERELFAGYKCTFSKTLSAGELSSSFRFYENGEALDRPSLQWDYNPGGVSSEPSIPNGQYTSAAPIYLGAWYPDEAGEFALARGALYITRHLWATGVDDRDSAQTLKLGLRLALEPQYHGRAKLDAEFEKSGGPFHLSVNWTELTAFVLGGEQLFLVAINQDRRMVDQYELDRELLLEVGREVDLAFGQIAEMRVKYHEMCEYTEDVVGPTIYVT